MGLVLKSSEYSALFFCHMPFYIYIYTGQGFGHRASLISIQAMGLVIGLGFQSTQSSAIWLGIELLKRFWSLKTMPTVGAVGGRVPRFSLLELSHSPERKNNLEAFFFWRGVGS